MNSDVLEVIITKDVMHISRKEPPFTIVKYE